MSCFVNFNQSLGLFHKLHFIVIHGFSTFTFFPRVLISGCPQDVVIRLILISIYIYIYFWLKLVCKNRTFTLTIRFLLCCEYKCCERKKNKIECWLKCQKFDSGCTFRIWLLGRSITGYFGMYWFYRLESTVDCEVGWYIFLFLFLSFEIGGFQRCCISMKDFFTNHQVPKGSSESASSLLLNHLIFPIIFLCFWNVQLWKSVLMIPWWLFLSSGTLVKKFEFYWFSDEFYCRLSSSNWRPKSMGKLNVFGETSFSIIIVLVGR